MKKRFFSLLCVFAVALVFALTAQTASLSWNVGAEESSSSATTTKKGSAEEPYEDPTTASTSATQTTASTTESTTKKEEPSSKPTESSTNSTDPTTKPTDKPPVSESDVSSSPNTSEKDSTKAPNGTTTTKKGGKTTTTRYTTTKPYVPHMTVPQIDNTTVEGTTLNPLDAYFERISGDSNTFTTFAADEETQAAEPEEGEHKQLSTIALVAICLGGIALVTVALTAGFAIRNKHADDDEDAAADYEKDAYGADEYDAPDAGQPQTAARPQVDESDAFTVVSLDDKDYTD